ncbi:phosphatidylinositol 3-kinase catalytic subunit type 3 [Zootermopsis nevadensis]|uniref:Phosphatidylinositol 3-kinase catalytic subunit type 3 n=1 Tax=Zootermopsis nevadensis TaxID=136037 RepID=A0A067RKC6_ZOONE|nr:phosphatidylinositol 3-kinase catalytic subunit type 3 [Zootermopsis nevadensis]KDR23478.1 Phosphatidylinositol 3-kinase catalytic subunit type 3 [Zootermopsis nevadensis]
MDEIGDKFCYVYSSSLETRIQIKIGTLEGKQQKPDYGKLLSNPMLKFSGLYQDEFADLMVVCQVFSDGRPLALPVSTSYKAFTTRWNWNEWVTLPVMFSDLPRNAQLALTICDAVGPSKVQPVGGTTISLFGKHGVFRQGMLDLRVWPKQEADGSFPSSTPGKARDHGREQMQRLAKLSKKHRNGHIAKVDWLDRLTFREIEMINEKEKRNSDYMYLMIEFTSIELEGIPHSIVFYEQDGIEAYQFRRQADLVRVPDHEILQENLVESKHHKLARSLRSGVSDKDAKPNASVRDILNTIVAYPPTKQLATEEQDLVWKFRFYLSNQKKALTKFLKCVNWKLSGEVRQALDMLQQWTPMDVEDALELLSSNFTHPAVRRYAVTRLKQAPDEDLLLYLLQLVQALKYENFNEIKEGYSRLFPGRDASVSSQEDNQSERTTVRETRDPVETTMKKSFSFTPVDQAVGADDASPPVARSNSLLESLVQNSVPAEQTDSKVETGQGGQWGPEREETSQDLATFLIWRACQNSTLANYFYWYLLIECEDQELAVKQDSKVRDMYLTVMKTFSQILLKGNSEWQRRRNFLSRQQTFIDKLVRLVKTVARESGNRKKKTEQLQALLADSEAFKINFASFEPLPFPLDPDVHITGIIPEKATLFKSALMPSKLTFLTTEGTEYVAIFKYGDDLRQDQLILQMITLMDKLLQKEKLDLKLTPYRVLATSTRHGFLQYVESTPVAEVLGTEGSIQNFFRKHHPSETGPFGIAPDVMDTYTSSCAGYCVITYLLGVGDRHLDNLLLTTSGKLFHIDFGYILGRDPKPLPPPMKLSKEMVEAMGGINSEYYYKFRKQCYTAFLHLRRNSNLVLNLFSLMVDASVPDIALEPDKAVKKVQDKLRLDLEEEEAVSYLHTILDVSVTAVMAVLVEQLHKFAQYWRK